MEFAKEHWEYICELGVRINKLKKEIQDIKSIFEGLKETIER